MSLLIKRPFLPSIIGIAGFQGAGKDILAEGLCATYAYRMLSLDAAVRLEVKDKFSVSPVHDANKDKPLDGPGTQTYRELITAHGMARRRERPTFWIDQLALRVHKELDNGERVVISDVRMPEEIEWIQKNRGVVVWVNRSGVVSNDVTTDLDNRHLCDYVIENDTAAAARDELAQRANELILTTPSFRERDLSYWVVSGGIPGTDEDQTFVISSPTYAEAIDRFKELVWEDECLEEMKEDRQAGTREHFGSHTYIQSVLHSRTPIEYV